MGGATALTSGSGGASGATSIDHDNDDDAGPPHPTHEDLGKGTGRDVVTIGDSWMSNTLGTGSGIEGALSRLTRQPYRNYGVQGVMLLSASLFGAAIPTQYENAKRIDPKITTVIMTGGGNDIIQNPTLQASCNTGGEECKQLLMDIGTELNRLWTEMAADGVKDVIYIRYSEDAGSTDPSLRGSTAMPQPICLSGKIRCHSVETTDAVMKELLADGIHPTQAANERIAKVVFDLMVSEGIRR